MSIRTMEVLILRLNLLKPGALVVNFILGED